jgi:transcription elongation factor GreA-like protein
MRQVLNGLRRIEQDDMLDSHLRTFYELEENYKEAFRMFTGQIKVASKNTTASNHLYQLLLRLDYNGFYELHGSNPIPY